MTWLLILILIPFGLFVSIIILFMNYRHKLTTIQYYEDSDLPDAIRSQCQPGVEALLPLGFGYHHAQKILHNHLGGVLHEWQLVFLHRDHNMYAIVHTPIDNRNAIGFEIVFESIYTFPHTLVTRLNTPFATAPIDGIRNEIIYTDDVGEAYRFHRHLSENAPETPKKLSAGAYIAHDLRISHYEAKQNIHLGIFKQREDGSLNFTLKGAFSTILRQFIGTIKVSRPRKQLMKKLMQHHLSVESDIERYHRQIAAEERSLGMWGKLGLFFFSMVLFALAFGFTLSDQTIAIILVVLTLHEGGHLLAMYLLGYRDLQVLFLPFLGAVATSGRPQFSIVKSFVVSLMGPLPGIVLGLGLLWYADPAWPEWTDELAFMLLFLNLLNLLPVMPLDGGQIMNELLFFRHPRMQVLFSGFSALLFLWLAYTFGEEAWLFAFLTLWLTYDTCRKAMFRRAFFRWSTPQPDAEACLQRIFTFFAQSRYRSFSTEKRNAFAAHIMEHRMIRPAGIATATLLLLIYGVALLTPPVLIVKKQLFPSEAVNTESRESIDMRMRNLHAAELARWEPHIEAAPTGEARWEILMQAGQEYYEYEDDNRSCYYYRRARTLAAQQWPKSDRLLRALRGVGECSMQLGGPDEALWLEILALQETLGIVGIERAEAYEALASGDCNLTAAAKYRRWQEAAITIREAHGGSEAWHLAFGYETLAQMQLQAGDTAGAEVSLQKALELYAPENKMQYFNAVRALVHFYLARGRYATAQQTLQRYLPPTPDDDLWLHRKMEWAQLYGWAHFMNARPEAAKRQFIAARDYYQKAIDDVSWHISLLNLFMETPDAPMPLAENLQDLLIVSLALDDGEAEALYAQIREITARPQKRRVVVRPCAPTEVRNWEGIVADKRAEAMRTMAEASGLL